MIRTVVLFFFIVTSVFSQECEKGKQLFAQKKYTEAKSYLEQCYKQNPNDAALTELLGDAYGHLKEWDNALGIYKKLKDKFPSNADYWYKYGGAMGMKAKSVSKFKALGMIDDVENAFLKAAKLDAKHIDTRWALVMLYIELPGIVGGSEKKAQKYADELMVLSKVDGYLAKGYIDEYFSRNSKAEANYKKAHEIGNSKTTFQKLYHFYLNKIKDKTKAKQLKEQFENK